jgi:hypothetical protein
VCTTCPNGVLDGDETDVDCGGSCAADCEQGQACAANADCVSRNCEGGVCGAGTCLASRPAGCECADSPNINPNEIAECQVYVDCFIDNACSPTATCADNDGVCGVNTLGGGTAPFNHASWVFSCACDEPVGAGGAANGTGGAVNATGGATNVAGGSGIADGGADSAGGATNATGGTANAGGAANATGGVVNATGGAASAPGGAAGSA